MEDGTRVFSALHIAPAELVASALRAEGIDSWFKNEHIASLAGELPVPDCMVEVWVDAEKAEQATSIVMGVQEEGPKLEEPVPCPKCSSEVDAFLARCWKCGQVLHEAEGVDYGPPITAVGKRKPPATPSWPMIAVALLLIGLAAFFFATPDKQSPAQRRAADAQGAP